MSIKKQVSLYLGVILFIGIGATLATLYAKGYRFGLDTGKATFGPTGLLVATSVPDSAEVLIDGHLVTATNNTLNLSPGEYQVKIQKEGYFPWQKKIIVQKEIVSKADALLMPVAPMLQALTFSGVQNPVIDPSQSRIAYTVASQSAKRNGIYVLDLNARPVLNLQTTANQIADDSINEFSKAILAWSPDGQQLLAAVPNTDAVSYTYYLLDANNLNNAPQDITLSLDNTLAGWQKEQKDKDTVRLSGLRPALRNAILKYFRVVGWSPDETKILYTASQSASLPIIVNPRLIGVDSTQEERNLEQGATYVYDIKEDRNYQINVAVPAPTPTPSPSQEFGTEPTPTPTLPKLPSLLVHMTTPLRWFSDSAHLVYTHDKKIDIMEYDGANVTTIFAGPFEDTYAFPWPNGGKVVILTDLGNTQVPPNLYSIGLK